MKKITRKAKQVSQNNLKFISTRLVASDVKRLIVKKSGGREREGRIIESDGGGGIEGARAIWKSNDFRSWLHSFQEGWTIRWRRDRRDSDFRWPRSNATEDSSSL